ncbi:hypothetical protein BS50DRAFT_631118 [Corynespora cassiicola Philippines]|uniref:DUF7605 domain-containing protein n=1 Tax=Corynespora cassiicola Philippines TaxID=1448308 RepID=A0A2T2P174_CORCC|nr:hypothetical protein BS50DRAFT_631118 [Corynespora cassiicola Philippines]
MATCTTMTSQDPVPRTPTPTSTSTFQVVGMQDSSSPTTPSSQTFPDWQHVSVNVISPSTASHHSMFLDEDEEDEACLSPKLALFTSNLPIIEPPEEDSFEALTTLISPSAPVQYPGDELIYDIATEERPEERFFDQEFQDSLKTTKKEIKNISLAIWGCSASHQQGSDLYALKEWARELSEFEPSMRKTLGIVGASKTGKSSVINSLLDQPHLTFATSAQHHSSSVITEYRYRPAHYNEPFAIEVDYLAAEEIRELLGELLKTFRACYVPTFHRDVEDIEERRQIRSRSERAWHTLQSICKEQSFFTKELLVNFTGSEVHLVDTLLQWANETLVQRPGGPESQTWSTTAFTVEECADKLDVFIGKSTFHDLPVLWPFIRIVRVYLRAAILQSGVVLADCPAPYDLDFAQACATERYLRKCHEVFAVTTMNKAASDASIADVISRNGRHRPLRIICTQSEDLQALSVERTDPEVSSQVRAWRQQIETLHKQTKRLEAQRRNAIAGALEEETKSKDMTDEIEFGLKKFLVERRNFQVATQLIEKYANRVQSGDLKVFCVSNQDYFNHRWDEKTRAQSRLDLSGIVNLRRYCHSIPAAGQFESASVFIQNEVPAFLGSLHQWAAGSVDAAGAETGSDVPKLMQELEKHVMKNLILPSAHFHTTRSNLEQEFAASIVQPIRENRSEWRNAAFELSKEWSKWPADSYQAFCRHQGTHTTPATGTRNWNEELIAPMRMQLQSNWGFFQESIEENEQELITSISKVFHELHERLQSSLPPVPFLSTLHPRLATLTHHIRTTTTTLLDASLALESDTLYGHSTSPIAILMAPAYHSAINPIVPAFVPLPPSPPPPPFTSPTSPTLHHSGVVTATATATATAPSPHPPSPQFPIHGPGSMAAAAAAAEPCIPPPPPTPTRGPSLALLHSTRAALLTSHIASARLFPRIAAHAEVRFGVLLSRAFEGLMAEVGREVERLVRDLQILGGSVKMGGRGREAGRAFRERVLVRVRGAEGVVAEMGRRVGGRR